MNKYQYVKTLTYYGTYTERLDRSIALIKEGIDEDKAKENVEILSPELVPYEHLEKGSMISSLRRDMVTRDNSYPKRRNIKYCKHHDLVMCELAYPWWNNRFHLVCRQCGKVLYESVVEEGILQYCWERKIIVNNIYPYKTDKSVKMVTAKPI